MSDTYAADGETLVYNLSRDYGINEALPLLVSASAFNDKVKEIQTLEAKIKELEAEREWISVKDRLPEHGEIVLVSNGDVIGYCKRNHKYNWIVAASNDRCAFDSVTHWMPLPKSPKGDE